MAMPNCAGLPESGCRDQQADILPISPVDEIIQDGIAECCHHRASSGSSSDPHVVLLEHFGFPRLGTV
jgi:hypothetical protein